MDANKKEELLKLIDERIELGGIGYLERYPEDDIEDRRCWGELHDTWYETIYGLLEIRDYMNNL